MSDHATGSGNATRGSVAYAQNLTATERRIIDAEAYLNSRTGCYEYRCERYDAALEAMHGLGLDDDCTVVDCGSGWGEFGVRMHTGRLPVPYWGGSLDPAKAYAGGAIPPSRARYIPIDAAVDGTDLEHWRPRAADWFVCLEVLEHLKAPARLLTEMIAQAKRGVIVSTPNPETVDVLACDATHRTPITRVFLEMAGMQDVNVASFYGQPDDSLFAVYSPRFL